MAELNVPSDRPTARCDAVIAAAAAELLQQLRRAGYQEEHALDDLTSALRECRSSYDVAQRLNRRHGWLIDDETLEVLQDARVCLAQAHRDVIADWVRRRNIRPMRSVGAQVVISYRGIRTSGEVVRIDEEQATYTLCCPELGHVRSGKGVHGLVVDFEEVHGLCPPPETFELELQSA